MASATFQSDNVSVNVFLNFRWAMASDLHTAELLINFNSSFGLKRDKTKLVTFITQRKSFLICGSGGMQNTCPYRSHVVAVKPMAEKTLAPWKPDVLFTALQWRASSEEKMTRGKARSRCL